ncbi:MAG: hypothetical protein K0Q97_1097 [Bacillota bacterium]|jgi:diaminopimelate epimerase|nr:hypothetical protein [Bacillota bacterium]
MNEYDVLLANPAGNITAIVLNENVKKENYIEIANKLMELKQYNIEQVGFVKKPQMGGELRLEMMGGEFCGNATRSFGLYLAQLKGELDDEKIAVEISGCSDLVFVETNLKNKYTKTQMPLPKNIFEINLSNGKNFSVIEFEGIFHAICWEDLNDNIYDSIKEVIYEKYNPEAMGVIFLNKDSLEIKPIVYVKETNSKVYEQSCGSGSIAAAVFLSKDNNEGIYTYNIKNPGGIIEVILHKLNGKFIMAFMGGTVELSEIININL